MEERARVRAQLLCNTYKKLALFRASFQTKILLGFLLKAQPALSKNDKRINCYRHTAVNYHRINIDFRNLRMQQCKLTKRD